MGIHAKRNGEKTMNLIGTSTFNATSVVITRKRVPVQDTDRSIDIIYITTTVMVGKETVTVTHEVIGDNVTVVTE